MLGFFVYRDGAEGVVDGVDEQMDTLEDMDQMKTKLEDPQFKTALIQYLGGIGGHNAGDCVRRTMARLGTNNLWSQFSLKGKKAKKSFQDHPLCRIILQASTKHSKNKEFEVEAEIAEFLKHAPSKKGGSRFTKGQNQQ